MDSYQQRGQIRREVRSDQKGGTKGHQNKMMKHNHVEGREKNESIQKCKYKTGIHKGLGTIKKKIFK